MKTKTKDAKSLKKKVPAKGSNVKAKTKASVQAAPIKKAGTKKVTDSKTKVKSAAPKVKEPVKAPATTSTKPAAKKPVVNLAKDLKATLANRASVQQSNLKKENEQKFKKYKPNKKTRYTAKELTVFKNILLDERNKILESAKANMESLVDDESGEYVGDNQTYSSHMAEQGSDEMEREKNYMFVQRDEKYLGYLQEALVRIDQGTYGVCIECFDHPRNLCRTCPLIPSERLELVPITQHCIECKNLLGK